MLSLDLGYYIPTGAGIASIDGSFGYQGQIEFRTNEYTGIDLTLGYINWENSSNNITSLRLGPRFYWLKNGPTPYTGFNLGLFRYIHKSGYYRYSSSEDTDFGISFFQGVLLPFSKNFFLNIDLNFTGARNSIGPNMFITINVGFSILL